MTAKTKKEDKTYSTLEVLAHAAAVIERQGEYVSTGRAKLDSALIPTADCVKHLFWPSKWTRNAQELVIGLKVEDRHREAAAELIRWGREEFVFRPDSEYDMKLRAALAFDDLEKADAGIAASGFSARARDLARRAEIEADTEPYADEWFAPVGQRVATELVVTEVRDLTSSRGFAILKLRDRFGHRFVTFVGEDSKLAKALTGHGRQLTDLEGATLNLKGTVNRHGEYQGRKETVINRTSLVH